MPATRIPISQVITVLRSFNAPDEVINYFVRMDDTKVKADSGETKAEIVMRNAVHLGSSLGYVKRADLQKRVLSMSRFRNSPEGSLEAFNKTMDELISVGKIALCTADEAQDVLKTNATVYRVT